MIASFAYLLHPLAGNGYQFWSGIGSDFGELTIVVALVAIYHSRVCHADGCYRPSWHVDSDGHGHPLCRHHHPHGRGRRHTIGGLHRGRHLRGAGSK